MKVIGLLLLLVVTWAIHVFHLGVFPIPELPGNEQPHSARWIDKRELGIHQLVLEGPPYERGLDAGRLEAPLLYRQEKELTDQLKTLFPTRLLRLALEVPLIRWYWGVERYLEPWMTQEMYGVSLATSHDFDDLADRFTRQVAYHGLHEVGQLMVDQGSEDMGCTVVAVPHAGSWVIGRNFDFEGGRVFDSEKVMKWVFPEKGFPYVSVIWSGMVGVVTGVNAHGVYLSLNAAGSRDVRRQGTPSTLVLLKALQFSRTAAEAVTILQKEKMFITDIFVVADPKSPIIYRVEKSPRATAVLALKRPIVVTNHLIADRWERDKINLFRQHALTSGERARRGYKLINELHAKGHVQDPPLESGILAILRDKGEDRGKPLHLGNRRAIDAGIATHAVVYNAARRRLFVSKGPGVSGELIGFDLEESFRQRKPVLAGRLPRDPIVSDALFDELRATAKAVSKAGRLVRAGQCEEAGQLLEPISRLPSANHYAYHSVRGDFLIKCQNDLEGARAEWKTALSLGPAYPEQARLLEERHARGEVR